MEEAQNKKQMLEEFALQKKADAEAMIEDGKNQVHDHVEAHKETLTNEYETHRKHLVGQVRKHVCPGVGAGFLKKEVGGMLRSHLKHLDAFKKIGTQGVQKVHKAAWKDNASAQDLVQHVKGHQEKLQAHHDKRRSSWTKERYK